jgi:UDP-2,3-diacylglucosamine hydrolase
VLAFFVSDVHLSPQVPDVADLFLSFLARTAGEADQLYVLGDLFDYWLGDDSLEQPFERRIADRLAAVAAGRTEIHFMPGNRDFLVGARFIAETGMRALPEATVCDINGCPALLLHGDTLCTDDAAYWEFRDSVRSPDWQRNFLGQPLAVRRQQVEALRNRSENAKREKSEALMDVNGDAVAAAFRDAGVATMIHGHVHRQGHHQHTVDSAIRHRWVLGDWGRSGSYLRCEGADWRLVAFPGAT